MRPVTRGDYSGDYIHYGIREHGMAAAMNGIAPVSYTHLDVYKRQVSQLRSRHVEKASHHFRHRLFRRRHDNGEDDFRSDFPPRGHHPVSYTHLDVYKRQGRKANPLGRHNFLC